MLRALLVVLGIRLVNPPNVENLPAFLEHGEDELDVAAIFMGGRRAYARPRENLTQTSIESPSLEEIKSTEERDFASVEREELEGPTERKESTMRESVVDTDNELIGLGSCNKTSNEVSDHTCNQNVDLNGIVIDPYTYNQNHTQLHQVETHNNASSSSSSLSVNQREMHQVSIPPSNATNMGISQDTQVYVPYPRAGTAMAESLSLSSTSTFIPPPYSSLPSASSLMNPQVQPFAEQSDMMYQSNPTYGNGSSSSMNNMGNAASIHQYQSWNPQLSEVNGQSQPQSQSQIESRYHMPQAMFSTSSCYQYQPSPLPTSSTQNVDQYNHINSNLRLASSSYVPSSMSVGASQSNFPPDNNFGSLTSQLVSINPSQAFNERSAPLVQEASQQGIYNEVLPLPIEKTMLQTLKAPSPSASSSTNYSQL